MKKVSYGRDCSSDTLMGILLLSFYQLAINHHADLKHMRMLYGERENTIMSNNWMTTAEAVVLISKNSHHTVDPSHVKTLVNRGKIGTRSLPGGRTFLKRSDVQATRVALGIGHGHHRREG